MNTVNLLDIEEAQTTLGEYKKNHPNDDDMWAWKGHTDMTKPCYVYTYHGIEIGAILEEPANYRTLVEFAQNYLDGLIQ